MHPSSSFCTNFLSKLLSLKPHAVDRTNYAEVDNSVNLRFKGDLQQVPEESLSLFPVVQLKAEQRSIIEKIVRRRDVFSNW